MNCLKRMKYMQENIFYPAVNDMTCYKDQYSKYETPIARDVSLNILTLPLYENLELTDVDKICDVILSKK